MLKRLFDLFLFSSLFIAFCAVIMVLQTDHLLELNASWQLPAFVFFSTICSYNFHWYLTPDSFMEHTRAAWTRAHRILHLALFVTGLAGAAWFFFSFPPEDWVWLGMPAVLTFLYSAPKMPLFAWLKKVAVGKTIFLATVWMYVTTLLPIILSGQNWRPEFTLFTCSRFFLIYAICVVFDYRDRENDRKDGIRSMITFFSEKGIDALFYGSLTAFLVATAALWVEGYQVLTLIFLLIPGLIVMALYKTAKRNFSDYLYYFVLDGMMMFSGLLTVFSEIR